ncbi:MAG: Nif3-like dinuclear metal center hexameric protein, partial [FCB group bacterium]|nr:Nif3-like dinuclear metal center hexameric protein [FCB group bacterium]
HQKLGTDEGTEIVPSGIVPGRKFEMDYLHFGPDVPEIIGCISGGGGSYYESALSKGIDTFITGDIREHIPAIAFESKTNYINIGHYWSETPGIKALQSYLENKYPIETVFLNINNRI